MIGRWGRGEQGTACTLMSVALFDGVKLWFSGVISETALNWVSAIFVSGVILLLSFCWL